MAKIELLDMTFYAHHGCFDEEQRVGTHFVVDVTLETEVCPAALTDALEDAVDYAKVYTLVSSQMAIPSKLLEHVAARILRAITGAYSLKECTVSVSKLMPAVGGKVGRSKVTLSTTDKL